MAPSILVASRKGLFVYSQNGSAWEVSASAFVGDELSLAFADPRDGAIYAALKHGHFGPKLHRSDDGGRSFEEVGLPTYPERPDDFGDKNRDGTPLAWSLERIWAFAAGGADQPGRIWAGTIPGGLFKSDDRGANWQLVESLWLRDERKEWFGGGMDIPGIHSICVDPRNSSRVAIGISCGGCWVSEDDGESWSIQAKGMRAEYMPPDQAMVENVQDPHCIVQCRTQPDKYWCQHHNGIFRSQDNCTTWQEIENVAPSAFGFATVVHPDDGETAWFVPAIKDEKRIPVDGALVVNRTRDGGQSFETLREGLPQQHAYDLVFRHALALDNKGECLAFGSSTGALFFSGDQGDSWTTINAHLPPIYSVDFIE